VKNFNEASWLRTGMLTNLSPRIMVESPESQFEFPDCGPEHNLGKLAVAIS